MRRRRVKITGIGPVTPAGVGCESFWQGITQPVSRVRPFTALGAEHGPIAAAFLERFNVAEYVKPTPALRGAARHTLFAVAGTALALTDAGLALDELRTANSAIVTGTSVMDFGGICRTADSVHKFGAKGADGRVVFTTNVAAVAGTINRVFGLAARTMALQSSCCSGLDAIGHAAGLIARGEVDIALCGGAEAPLHRMPMLELRAAGLAPQSDEGAARIGRPFDLWRTTGVVSEGACLFVLEPEESPRAGYSFVAGYAHASDAATELCGGMVPAMRRALADARLRPAAIDAISAWGPGHREIDAAETRALQQVFNGALQDIPVVSIKGAIGTPLGASGAIQVAAAALGQRAAVVPPTANWEYPDPACELNLSARARALPQARVLVNAHGLAGVNTAVILERC
ncbi:beta-ketoacyl-[acyl-carrier-protein] synthase family protein [Opitutus terrae]|nr:beta-ketoacyl synthase N-terminal-like domain-containing protein [Opitutus terrae]